MVAKYIRLAHTFEMQSALFVISISPKTNSNENAKLLSSKNYLFLQRRILHTNYLHLQSDVIQVCQKNSIRTYFYKMRKPTAILIVINDIVLSRICLSDRIISPSFNLYYLRNQLLHFSDERGIGGGHHSR